MKAGPVELSVSPLENPEMEFEGLEEDGRLPSGEVLQHILLEKRMKQIQQTIPPLILQVLQRSLIFTTHQMLVNAQQFLMDFGTGNLAYFQKVLN